MRRSPPPPVVPRIIERATADSRLACMTTRQNHSTVLRNRHTTVSNSRNVFAPMKPRQCANPHCCRPLSARRAHAKFCSPACRLARWQSLARTFGNQLGGVCCYGPVYGENLGVWDRYDFTSKIIGLLRGACAYWAHPHAGSALIKNQHT
jgi:hypothetical protein